MLPTTKHPSAPASPAGVDYNFSPKKIVSGVASVRDKIDFSSDSNQKEGTQEKSRKIRVINTNFENEFKDPTFVSTLPKLGSN